MDIATIYPKYLCCPICSIVAYEYHQLAIGAIGIIADLLMDTHLGQQAFAAVMVAMVIKITSIYIRQLNTISAWLIASLGLVVFQVSLWILQLFIQNTFVAQSALSLFMSIISWPLVLLALRRFAR